MRKSLREVLHQADPNLRIISGGVYHHATERDWDSAAGVVCRSCGHEVFRSRDGLCLPCWEKENEFQIRDKTGMGEFLPRTVIMEIARKPNTG